MQNTGTSALQGREHVRRTHQTAATVPGAPSIRRALCFHCSTKRSPPVRSSCIPSSGIEEQFRFGPWCLLSGGLWNVLFPEGTADNGFHPAFSPGREIFFRRWPRPRSRREMRRFHRRRNRAAPVIIPRSKPRAADGRSSRKSASPYCTRAFSVARTLSQS